jgi:hypothetical protein
VLHADGTQATHKAALAGVIVKRLADSATPELQQRCMSQINEAMGAAAANTNGLASQANAELLVDFVRQVAAPVLLDCRVRFLHKGMLHTVRRHAEAVAEEWLPKEFSAFIDRAATDVDALGGASEPLTVEGGDCVTHIMACIDCVTVLLAPAFPGAFSGAVVAALPLFVTLLRRSIPATAQRNDDVEAVEGAALNDLLSDEVERVRFSMRTVTSLLHKFVAALAQASAGSVAVIAHLGELCASATAMLRNDRLPKDVLNAAGLLVATVITLHRRDAAVVAMACRSAAAALTARVTLSDEQVREAVLRAVSVVLNSQEVDERDLPHHVSQWFCGLTQNGVFSLYKGFLSHCIAPASKHGGSGGPSSQLVLFEKPHSVLLRIMAPAALAWAPRLDNPDARFVALQTIDSSVRHIGTVLDATAKRCNAAETLHLIDATQLNGFMTKASDIVTALWDDPTQKVAGPLNETYQILLATMDTLATLASTGAAPAHGSAVQRSITQALVLSDDRRGKFHALLALVPRLPYRELVSTIAAQYGICPTVGTDGDATSVYEQQRSAVSGGFIAQVMAAATNNKVSNIIGELFVALSTSVKKDSDGAVEWQLLVVDSVVAACLLRLAASPCCRLGDRGTLLSLASDRGTAERRLVAANVITHIVMPLLKIDGAEQLLVSLLRGVTAGSTADALSDAAVSAVVQLLFRGRGLVSIERFVQHLTPTKQSGNNGGDDDLARAVCRVVRAGTTTGDADTRLMALDLLCFGTKAAARVTAEQSELMLTFVGNNLSIGGDSTFRNRLITIMKRWCRRLSDSVRSAKTRTPTMDPTRSSADGGKKNKRKDKASKEAPQYRDPLASNAANHDVFVANWEQYVLDVFTHIRAMVQLCTSNLVGDFSVDRRHSSIQLLLAMYGSVIPLLSSGSSDPFSVPAALKASPGEALADIDTYLPTPLLSPLLAALEDGWDSLRGGANSLLSIYMQHAPMQLGSLLSSTGTTSAVKAALTTSSYRVSEGGVLKSMLLMRTLPLAEVAAAASAELTECELRVGQLRDDSMDQRKRFQLFASQPIHGRLSLVGNLLELLVGDKRSGDAFGELVARSVLLCISSLELCTVMVGGDDDAVAVDCRGHAFQPDGTADDEATNRVVVNNSWLGARASTATLQRIIAFVAFPSAVAFPPALAKTTGEALMAVLLRTKHNGVMSKTRSALRTLTTALLQVSDAEYRTLPFDCFLKHLLGENGVQSTSAARMLRRSQGLPHTILPLLESEDPAVPGTLMPHTMNLLVAVGEKLSSTTVREADNDTVVMHGVNALNVLKFVFEDSILAGRLSPWIEPAFLMAAAGFRHNDWFVRNSSMMLFTSVVHRVVGDHPFKGGGGVSSSFSDLAQRFPRVMSYVHHAVTAAVKQSAETSSLQPEVFPLLLLLSLLRPDSEETSGSIDITAVTTAVFARKEEGDASPMTPSASVAAAIRDVIGTAAACLSLDNLMARSSGANALASLVPVTAAAATARSLVDMPLPVGGASESNAVHGRLVALRKLLRVYCGWEHDGTSHSVTGRLDGLRIRDSPTATAEVLAATRDAAVVVGWRIVGLQKFVDGKLPAAQRKMAVSGVVLEEFFHLAADVLFHPAPADDAAGADAAVQLAIVAITVVERLTAAQGSDEWGWSASALWTAASRALLRGVVVAVTLPATALAAATLTSAIASVVCKLPAMATDSSTSNLLLSVAAVLPKLNLAKVTGGTLLTAQTVVQWIASSAKCDIGALAFTVWAGLQDRLLFHGAGGDVFTLEATASVMSLVAVVAELRLSDIILGKTDGWVGDAAERCFTLLGHTATSATKTANGVTHQGVQCVALRLLAIVAVPFASQKVSGAVNLMRYLSVVDACIEPAQPLEVRFTAAHALSVVCNRKWSAPEATHALYTLVAVAFDDDDVVRHIARNIAAESAGRGSVCPATGLTQVVRDLAKVGGAAKGRKFQADRVRAVVLCIAGDDDGDKFAGDDDAEQEVLFDEEGDNMFAEAPVLDAWLALVEAGTAKNFDAAAESETFRRRLAAVRCEPDVV